MLRRRTFKDPHTSGPWSQPHVRSYSPGYMEQAPSRGHEASTQSGLGVGCKLCSSSKSFVGWVYVRRHGVSGNILYLVVLNGAFLRLRDGNGEEAVWRGQGAKTSVARFEKCRPAYGPGGFARGRVVGDTVLVMI